MQKFFSDWLTIAALPAVIGVTVALTPPSRGTGVLGAVTGSVTAASLTSFRKDKERKNLEQLLSDNEAQIKVLVAKIEKEQEMTDLVAQVSVLKAESDALEKRLQEKQGLETHTAQLKGQIKHQQALRDENESKLEKLNTSLQNIESKLSLIHQKNPDLLQKEALYKEIESLSLQREGLAGQLEALHEQLENLSQQKQELRDVEVDLSAKAQSLASLEQKLKALQEIIVNRQEQIRHQENLQKEIEILGIQREGLVGQIEALQDQLGELYSQQQKLLEIEAKIVSKQELLAELELKLEQLKIQAQEWEIRATELELLRATYDGLSGEHQELAERITLLKPEVDRLELEKQAILQSIQEHEQEYRQVEQLREQIRRIKQEIREYEEAIKDRQAEVISLEQRQATLRGAIEGLIKEKAKLEEEIKQIRGEIDQANNNVENALKSLKQKQWTQFPSQQHNFTDEAEFLTQLKNHLRGQGLSFSDRVIRSFHTSLKVQDISALVILAGISGTGKSQLPQHYADFIGAQQLTLAVQPRWDSPQDLQGFYNYIEQKFKPTDLMRGLWQYQNDPNMQDRIVIVLLDEMNLARVEYYFSDFLSKLESRRYSEASLELEVGSLPLSAEARKLPIPKQFLFVGTMNEDETTQSLSDKVLDRANVITFGRPSKLQARHEQAKRQTPPKYLSFDNFKKWRKPLDPNSLVVRKLHDILDETNQLMEKMGHPFAHRVYQSIVQYIVNYPGVDDHVEHGEAFNQALADQFGQKLLPKLRGVMIDTCKEELEELQRKIIEEKLNDRPLIDAFKKAKKDRFGQFYWSGLVYEDAPDKVFIED